MKTCCFTGHRPIFFPWKDNLSDKRAQKLISELKCEIENAIHDGYTKFLWGGALGVDTWAAECVVSAKEKKRKKQILSLRQCCHIKNIIILSQTLGI
mgnify:CR=1 FL=1